MNDSQSEIITENNLRSWCLSTGGKPYPGICYSESSSLISLESTLFELGKNIAILQRIRDTMEPLAANDVNSAKVMTMVVKVHSDLCFKLMGVS